MLMTYDDMLNLINEMYERGLFPDWVMTDSDCCQMRRDRRDGKFEFVEVFFCAPRSTGSALCRHSIIDLNDYSDDELWFYGSAYYDNWDEFFSQGAEIFAECVFEGKSADSTFIGKTPQTFFWDFIKTLRTPD